MAEEKAKKNNHFETRRTLFGRKLDTIGFHRVSALGPDNWGPLVWYAFCVLFLELIVLQVYNFGVGREIGFVENPIRIVPLFLVVGTAVAVQWLQARYHTAIQRSHINERCENNQIFNNFVSDKLVMAFIILGVSFTLVNAFAILTIPTIYEVGGPARVVRFVLIIPFGYVPIIATGLAAYITAEILVPRRLEQSEVSLDYLDPEKLGGVRPVGEFIKKAYYLAMVGLIAYAISIYGPYLLPGPLQYEEIDQPGRVANILFSAVWVATVAAMIYGIYVMHRFMSNEKREDLVKLEKQMHSEFTAHSSIEELTVANPPEGLEEYQKKAELIASTREYPATFTMWVQVIIGILLPKAIQMVLSSF